MIHLEHGISAQSSPCCTFCRRHDPRARDRSAACCLIATAPAPPQSTPAARPQDGTDSPQDGTAPPPGRAARAAPPQDCAEPPPMRPAPAPAPVGCPPQPTGTSLPALASHVWKPCEPCCAVRALAGCGLGARHATFLAVEMRSIDTALVSEWYVYCSYIYHGTLDVSRSDIVLYRVHD